MQDREADDGWEPVFLRGSDTCSVRILCGAVDPTSPFIEGGCSADWIEDLSGPDFALNCPRCGQRCPAEVVGCAREMLSTRSVFVIGCIHHAFTFSRRACEPYFSVGD